MEQESKSTTQTSSHEPRDYTIALLLAILLGGLGVDRFYMGKVGTGLLKLVLAGGIGLWWLYDIVMILSGNARDKQGQPLKK